MLLGPDSASCTDGCRRTKEPGGRDMSLEYRVRELAGEVVSVDGAATDVARERHLRLTKPAGSLGTLEELGARFSGMAHGCPPPVPERPAVVVAAGGLL